MRHARFGTLTALALLGPPAFAGTPEDDLKRAEFLMAMCGRGCGVKGAGCGLDARGMTGNPAASPAIWPPSSTAAASRLSDFSPQEARVALPKSPP